MNWIDVEILMELKTKYVDFAIFGQWKYTSCPRWWSSHRAFCRETAQVQYFLFGNNVNLFTFQGILREFTLSNINTYHFLFLCAACSISLSYRYAARNPIRYVQECFFLDGVDNLLLSVWNFVKFFLLSFFIQNFNKSFNKCS